MATTFAAFRRLHSRSALLVLAAVCAQACGGSSSEADGKTPTGAPGGSTSPSPPSGTSGSSTPAYGLGLRVGQSYIARRGQLLVAVPLNQVEAAVQKGWVVEFSRLSTGAIAFGDLCLAAETPSSLSGAVHLLACSEASVMKLFGYADSAQLAPAKPASPTASLTKLDTSSCPDASRDDCVLTLNVGANATSAVTVSPRALGQSPNGTLIHLSSNADKCLTDRDGVAVLTDCNVNSANQRWSWSLQMSSQPTFGVSTFSFVSELGRCLSNAGSDTAPKLTLGPCVSDSTAGWFFNGPSLASLDTSSAAQVFLTGDPNTSGVTLISQTNADPANDLYWQVGPGVSASH